MLAPRVGFEPTTLRLTAECSTAELSRNIIPSYSSAYLQNLIQSQLPNHRRLTPQTCVCSWSSPRPISNSPLSTLLHLHSCPINLVVFKGSYFLKGMGYLILEGASRLDAFSVYPFRTWLLCYAPGDATDTPAVRPPRSSRTKGSSPQISYARAG